MKPPFWATREFRWLVGGVLVIGTGLALLLLRIRPDIEAILRARAGGKAEPQGEAFAPAEVVSKLPPDPALDELLASVTDAQPLGAPDAAYLRLAERVSRLDPAALEAEARPIRYHLFRRAPAGLRGRAVQITGLFIHWKPIILEQKAGDVDLVYRLFLVDPSASEGYVVDVVTAPPAALRDKAMVTVEAVFLRTCVYEGQNGPVEAPLLIGRELRIAKAAYAPPPFETSGVMVGLVILSVAMLVVLIWLQRQIAARRRAAPLAPRLSTALAPPRPAPPAAPRKTFQWKKPPRLHAAPPGPDLAALTRRQQRRMMVLTVSAFIVLVALSAYTIYERYRGPQIEVVDLPTESARWLARAETVRQEVAAFEQKALEKGLPLEAADGDWLRARAKVLRKAAEAVQNLIESARQADARGLADSIEQSAGQLLRIKVWVLDADDLLASVGQPQPGGFFLPFWAGRKRAQAARDALAAVEKEAPGGSGREAIAARAGEAWMSLLEARETLRKLESYLVEGLARDAAVLDKIDDTRPLREESKLLDEAIARAQALTGSTP